MKNLLLFSMILSSFVLPAPKLAFKQGICGKIYLKVGNAMPSPGNKFTPGKPVIRKIFIYELTTRDQATANGSLYSNVKTKLIAQTQSDTTGYYAVNVPPGKYSLFVEEKEGLFASIFDGDGNINPVEVKPGIITKMDVTINNKAFY